MVSVLPVEKIEGIEGHPALSHAYIVEDETGKGWADAGAVFGANPLISRWEMSHGAGGGTESVGAWVDGAMERWRQAGTKISS